MNDRQRKKAYKAVNGYNPGKEQAVQQTIRDTETRLSTQSAVWQRRKRKDSSEDMQDS